jgi:hypothetical protein
MSTKNHTPIQTGAVAGASTFNSPLGQLDASVGDLSTLTTTAKTDIVLAVNELDATKQDNFTSQSANQVLASPNGSAGVPGFRALVNADLPASGATAGTFTKLTINSKGVATTGTNLSVADISDINTLAVDTLGATTDITTNNVSILKHGFFPKLINDATQIINGVGAWIKWAMGVKYNGSGTYTPRAFINFNGAGVNVQDDPANDAIKVTISGIAGGVQTLSTLTDVSFASPAQNEVVVFNASSNLWENKNISAFVPTGHVIGASGSNLTNRPTLNFSGTGVSAVDNSGNNRTDVIINTPAAPVSAGSAVEGLVMLASASHVTLGISGSLVISPSALVHSDYGKRGIQISLNGGTSLSTSDKGYFRVPPIMNGWNLVGINASSSTSSTSGSPTFTVKSGSQTMLSTDLKINQGATDSSISGSGTIDTSHDDVYTGNRIEIAPTTAGTGVTYAVVDLLFQLP